MTFTAGNRNSTLQVVAGGSLAVSGAVLIQVGNNNGITKLLDVGAGTLTAGSVQITGGGGATRVARLAIGTGTANVSGNVSFGGTNGSQLVFNGAGTLNLTGNLGAGAAVFTAGTGTINFNGAAAQTFAAYTYNIVKVNNTVGVSPLAATPTIATLTIGDVTANSLFYDNGFAVTGTTLNLTSGTYRLGTAGTATTYAFTTSNISAGTTVEYAAGANQAVSTAPAYANLVFSGTGGTKTTAGGTLTIGGNWTIGRPAALNTNNTAVDLAGNLLLNSTFTHGTGTFTMSGTGSITDNNGTKQDLGAVAITGGTRTPTTAVSMTTLTVSAGTYDASGQATTVTGLTTVSGGTYTAGAGTQTLGGGLTVSSGAFTGSNGTVDVIGNVTISGTATLTAPAAAGTFAVSGNWSNAATSTFAHNGGTVAFDGGGTQTLDSGGDSFLNVSHTGTGTLQLTNNALTVAGAFTTSAGTFNANGQAVTTTGLTTINNSTYEGSTALQTLTGGLSMTGGSLSTTGAGQVLLGADVDGLASATTSTIAGVLALGGATRTFTVADGGAAVDMDIPAVISGGAGCGIIKNGPGLLMLDGTNTYAGDTTINAGTVKLGPTVTRTVPPNPEAYYAFENNVLDGTPNAHDGAIVGGPTYVAGRQGQAMNFRGDAFQDEVTVPYSGRFAMNSFSVSAWVCLTAVPDAPVAGSGIIGTRNSGVSDNTFDFKAEFNGVAPNILHGDIGNGTVWLNTAIDFNCTMPVGTWHMITYVIDNAAQQVRMYFDSLPVQTAGFTGVPLFMKNNQIVHIGSCGGTSLANEYMVGLIDEMYIYDRALASDEIFDLYGEGSLPPTTNVLIANGAVLDLNGCGQTVASLADVGASGGSVTTTKASAPITLTLSSTGGSTSFSGVIAAGASAISLVKDGASTQTLSGANGYTGTTTVKAGQLIAGADAPNNADGALGNSATAVLVGDTAGSADAALLTGGAFTIGRPVTVQAGSTGQAILGGNTASSSTFSGAITLNKNASLTQAANGTTTFSGVIGGAGFGVTKTDAGTVVLSADNTYTGTTTATAGTLLVNGSQAGSAVSLNGGTLGGTGTVGTITAAAGGTLSPGVAGPGTLNISGNVTLNGTTTYTIEVNGTGAGLFDQLNVTGTVDLGGATLNAALGFVPAIGDEVVVVSNGSANPVTGTFAGLAEGASLTVGGQLFEISYLGGDGNDVVLTAVPTVAFNLAASSGSEGVASPVITVSLSAASSKIVTVDYARTAGTAVSGVNYTLPAGTLTFAVGVVSRDIPITIIDDGVCTADLTVQITLSNPKKAALGAITVHTYTIIDNDLVITARETQDMDHNGFIDAIYCVANAPLAGNVATLTVVADLGYVVTSCSAGASNNDFFVNLQEKSSGDTGILPGVQITGAGNVTRQNSVEALPVDGAPVTSVDRAQPVLMSADWVDHSGGGVSVDDDLILTFSESVTATGVVITNNVATSDIWLPVTSDTLSTSALPDQGPGTQLTIDLQGDPLFTPGGTYNVTALGEGSPSGIYVNNGAHITDAVGLMAFVQGAGTAVDISPGTETICIAWDEPTVPITPKAWDVGTTDLGTTFTAFASFPPSGLAARNAGNVRVKFTMSCSVAAPSGWTLATTAGTDQFEMKADITDPPYGIYTTDLATGPKDIATKLYSGHSKPFDLQFATPTALTVGAGVQQTITVTITATKD